jgi:putative N6-adenine-specific DNA methylase
MPWEDYFDLDKTLMVNATVYSRQFNHTLFIAQKVKDAIVDRFRERTGERPSVDTDNPDIRIDIYIYNENVIVSLDSSGHSLHRRGYRKEADVAPINEVLAAGILHLIGWKGMSHFIDPMCGSGTFLIEAAMMAHNIPPGVFRQEFAFKNWKNFDKELHDLLFEKALEKEKNFYYTILGFDKDPRVLLKAGRNIKNALLDEQIKIEKSDFLNFHSSREIKTPGILVFNPPYGIKFEANIPELYTGIGDTLKNKFAGFTAWIFTSSKEGLKYIGLKPSVKIPLYNAKLESWLVRYDLYEGTRKEKGNKE